VEPEPEYARPFREPRSLSSHWLGVARLRQARAPPRAARSTGLSSQTGSTIRPTTHSGQLDRAGHVRASSLGVGGKGRLGAIRTGDSGHPHGTERAPPLRSSSDTVKKQAAMVAIKE
jgi:hypothetical protein